MRVFFPICAYSRRLQSRAQATRIVSLIASEVDAMLIVIADSLQTINLQQRGFTPIEAERRCRITCDNTKKMYESIVEEIRSENVQIVLQSVLCQWEDFLIVQARLRQNVFENEIFKREATRFSNYSANHFQWVRGGGSHEREVAYLHLETCTSIFTTERMGFVTELWEKLPAKKQPDPIGLAYASLASEICLALSKPSLERELVDLDTFLAAAVERGR